MRFRLAIVLAVVAVLAILLAPRAQTHMYTGAGNERLSYSADAEFDSSKDEKDKKANIDSSGSDEWASRPVEVNIQINLENEGDEDLVYGILGAIEAHGWRGTVFVTGEFASKHPDVAEDIQDRGHQITVYGWETGEDLTVFNYTEQFDLIGRAFSAVRSAVRRPEEVVDFKAQGYRFNDDTLQALQALGVRSISGIFECDESFCCQCWYAQKLGEITFPYPITNDFWAIPISTIQTDSKKMLLDDRYVPGQSLTSQHYLDYLLEKYNEQEQTKDPLVIAVHASITGADDARLQAIVRFLEHVKNTGGKVVTLRNLTQEAAYITNLDATGPASASVGEEITIHVTYTSNLYCPDYRFRAYGRYPGEDWRLLEPACFYVRTGDHSFDLHVPIPRPPANQNTYTIRLVGRASFSIYGLGSCDPRDPDWPTYDSYEVVDEVQVLVLPRCLPVPGRTVGKSGDRIDLVFVPDDDYGAAADIAMWLPEFLANVNHKIDGRLGGRAPVSGNLNRFNFYYTREQGNVSGSNCAQRDSLPDNLIRDCPFADAVVALHRTEFVDCSTVNNRPNIYSAEGPTDRSFIHESGHGLFGLADEYDGPTHYFQPNPNPNIWETEDACRSDAASEGWDPDDCQRFTRQQGDWWKLGTTEYIMWDGTRFDNGWGQPAARRISWVFDWYEDSPQVAEALWLGLNISDNGITLAESRRIHDASPDYPPGVYDYAARVVSFEGELLGEYRFGDPRIILGEQGYTGPTWLASVDFPLILPYFYNGRTVNVYDTAGELLLLADVSQHASGAVNGTVTDYSGLPVSNALIQVTGISDAATLTDENGHYELTGLAPGGYTVSARPPEDANLMPGAVQVQVVVAQITTANFVLQPAGSIAGTVVSDGAPVPDAILYYSGHETPRYQTDSRGWYIMPGLSAGFYTVNIYAPDYPSDWRIFVNGRYAGQGTNITVDVVLGETTGVDFERGVASRILLPAVLRHYPRAPGWHRGTGLSGRTVYALTTTDATCNTLYAATDAGLYKSTNRGQSWTRTGLNALLEAASADMPEIGPAFEDIAGVSSPTLTPAVAVCPSDSRIVYAATWGQGVYKSTDAGATWQLKDSGLDDTWLYALAVHPQNCQIVYAATNAGGVFKSTNGGNSWIPVNDGLANLNTRSLAIAPSNPSVLHVGTTDGVFKTTDSGNRWYPTGYLPGDRVRALAVHPANAQIVYAGLLGHGVYKTTNGGNSWQPKTGGLGYVEARALAIDPLSPDTIYVGWDDGGGVYRSANGGDHWSQWNTNLGERNVKALTIDGGACNTLHAGTTDGAWYYGP